MQIVNYIGAYCAKNGEWRTCDPVPFEVEVRTSTAPLTFPPRLVWTGEESVRHQQAPVPAGTEMAIVRLQGSTTADVMLVHPAAALGGNWSGDAAWGGDIIANLGPPAAAKKVLDELFS